MGGLFLSASVRKLINTNKTWHVRACINLLAITLYYTRSETYRMMKRLMYVVSWTKTVVRFYTTATTGASVILFRSIRRLAVNVHRAYSLNKYHLKHAARLSTLKLHSLIIFFFSLVIWETSVRNIRTGSNGVGANKINHNPAEAL